MSKLGKWLRILLGCLAGGSVLSYGISLWMKISLSRSFEYAGALFLVLAVLLFMTPSQRIKTLPEDNNQAPIPGTGRRNPPGKSTLSELEFVTLFGLTGIILLFIPLFL